MRYKFTILSAFFLLFFGLGNAQANTLDIAAFGRIPILHEGRIKPIESYAKAQLKELSGHKRNALSWLVETTFNPALAETKPIIKVNNPDVLNTLELEWRETRLYTYKELSQGLTQKQDIIISILQSEEKDWTPAQRDLILLQQKTVTLKNLLNSLTAFIPLSVTLPSDVPEALKAHSNQTLSYLGTIPFHTVLKQELQKVIEAKGEALENYTDSEQALAYLSFSLANLEATVLGNNEFKVIPPTSKHAEWMTPWLSITGSHNTDAEHLSAWQDLVFAYHTMDQDGWNTASEKLFELSAVATVNQTSLKSEILYNKLAPFKLSLYLYSIALLFLFAHFFRQTPALTKISVFSLSAGLVFHIAGVILRVLILSRPPVSTLYESVLFVGLVSVLYTFWSYRNNRDILWLYLASGLGIALHILAFSNDQESDSLMMLTAVLNTNFWLATHVLCISIGYALCLITSILAHYILVEKLVNKRIHPQADLFQKMQTVALLSLLFATVGTVLGGIWADQSWGRFWGWDPKENGALLIVFWLIWLVHGRISGQINAYATTVGLAFLSVIVALSWFGVNLLNVGLHSYGFTDSMSWALFAFITAELLFVGTIILLQKRQSARAS